MASPSITSVTPRIAASISTAIQQRISSGNFFDGTLPQAAGPVRADSPLYVPGNSIYKYAAAAAGGLFFWNNPESLVCSQIHVDLGASGNITVSIVNLDPAHINDDSPAILAGEAMIIEQATAVRFIALDEARFKTILLPFQAIQIVTTASGAAQIAQVVASLEKTYVR
jgi:3-hydroxymyristoyl/3-hydroxydecanoyl-(acyl carrier protein) dehydratase